MFIDIKLFLKFLYRISIISFTLTLLNNEEIYNKKFIFTIISTTIVFYTAHLLNNYLKEDYIKAKKIIGFDLEILLGPLIISILYIIRHSCAKYLCIYKK